MAPDPSSRPPDRAPGESGRAKSWRTDPERNRRLRAGLAPLKGLLGPRTFRRLFGRLPVLGRVEIRLPEGSPLKLEAGVDDEVARELYFGGYRGFEPESIELFRRLARRADVIFDIGAHTGYYALVAALTRPEARVFAFEPLPSLAQRIRENASLNAVKNVAVIEVALAERDGEATLHVPRGATPSSASTMKGFRKRTTPLPVRAVRVDTFFADEGLDRLDLVKMDTEATEPAVLIGFGELLARFQPIILCEVLAGRTESALMDLLEPLGYRYWHVTDGGLLPQARITGDPTYRFPNYLFARTEPKL